MDTVTIDAVDITSSSPRVEIARVAIEHLLKLKGQVLQKVLMRLWK